MDSYEKYFGCLNNKQIIPLISLNLTSKFSNTIKNIEKGLELLVDQCNAKQKDVVFHLYTVNSIDIDNIVTYSLLIEDDCVFDNETVKTYFYTNIIQYLGVKTSEEKI